MDTWKKAEINISRRIILDRHRHQLFLLRRCPLAQIRPPLPPLQRFQPHRQHRFFAVWQTVFLQLFLVLETLPTKQLTVLRNLETRLPGSHPKYPLE